MKAVEIIQQIYGKVSRLREKCLYDLAGTDDKKLKESVVFLEREYGVRIHDKEYQTFTHMPIDALHEFLTKMQHEQAE